MAFDRQQVEQFLYYEAQIMDEHRYDEWLALWSDDALYWVPAGRDNIDPKREISLIYDDRVRLETRIAVEQLLARLPGLRLVDSAMVPQHVSALHIRGLQSLPVAWDTTASSGDAS